MPAVFFEIHWFFGSFAARAWACTGIGMRAQSNWPLLKPLYSVWSAPVSGGVIVISTASRLAFGPAP